MTDVADFIEEALGVEVFPWQRAIIDLWFPPPPPYVPPPVTWQVKAKRWFNRVVLRRKPGVGLETFDRVLKDVYGPGLREQINQSNTIMSLVAKHNAGKPGQRATWKVKP